MSFLTGTTTIESTGLTDTENLAKTLATEIKQAERVILIMDGEMGSGKTQFCRFLMEELEVDEREVASPSFAIHNSYESAIGPIEHIDLYRLTSEEDLESTGFWDLFLEKPRLVVIEWGVRLVEMGLLDGLPKTWPRLQMKFEITGLSTRRILFRRL